MCFIDQAALQYSRGCFASLWWGVFDLCVVPFPNPKHNQTTLLSHILFLNTSWPVLNLSFQFVWFASNGFLKHFKMGRQPHSKDSLASAERSVPLHFGLGGFQGKTGDVWFQRGYQGSALAPDSTLTPAWVENIIFHSIFPLLFSQLAIPLERFLPNSSAVYWAAYTKPFVLFFPSKKTNICM